MFPSASALAPPSRHRIVASCSHPPRRRRLRREPPFSTAWIGCHRCRTSLAASGPDRPLPYAFSRVIRRTRCWSASRFSIERQAVRPRPSATAPEQSGPHWDQKVPTAALVWPSSLWQGKHDAVELSMLLLHATVNSIAQSIVNQPSNRRSQRSKIECQTRFDNDFSTDIGPQTAKSTTISNTENDTEIHQNL